MTLKPPGTPNASINALYGLVNAVSSGARGDGITDNTSVVNSLITTVSAAGGGTIVFDAGTFIGNFVARSNVTLQGNGAGATVLKAKAGSNDDVIKGANFATLTGKTKATGDYALGCPQFELRDLTVDGNKATQSSGYGVRLWGRCPRLSGTVVIRNCKTGGMWTEFTDIDSFLDSEQILEGMVDALSIQNCDGNGWTHRGPHDMVVKKCEIWGCTGWAVRVEQATNSYNGGVYFRHLNFFLCGNGAYNNGSLFEMHGGAITGETGTGLESTATTGSMKIRGVIVAGHAIGILLRGVSHQIDAQMDRNTTSALQLDGAYNCRIAIHGAANENAVNNLADGGANMITGLFDVAAAKTLKTGAAFNTGSSVMLKSYGGAGSIVIQQSPGFITFTGSTAADVPNSSLFRDSSDNKLKWRDAAGVVNNLY